MPKRGPKASGPGSSPSTARPKRKSARERGYTWEWEKARLEFLAEHPFCEECLLRGVVETATVVDHKIPHRGDMALFWDRSNWRSLSQACHDAKRGEEKKPRRG